MSKKSFRGETPEELAKSIAGQVDEKYQKSLMDIVNKAMNKTGASPDASSNDSAIKKINICRTDDSNPHKREIIIIRTATSTLIAPILIDSSVKTDISIEITPQDTSGFSMIYNRNTDSETISKEIENADVSLSVETNAKSKGGLVPLLVIPHNSEGNDNEASITQIIEFLQLSYTEHIFIENFDFSGVNVAGKLVIIK